MQSNWNQVSLGDVAHIRRGSSPRPIINFMSDNGMPWVKIADATENDSRFINSTKEFIKEEGVAKSVIVEKGDLILSNSGTAGLPKFMGITACVHDGWQVFKELNGINIEFLYYTLINIRSALLHNAYDSTMKNLTLDMVREAKINLPSLPIQKKIAHILSTLDDKIELNRKKNQTLEEMSQALFKSWFVDFDPVYANANAKSEEELEAAAAELGVAKEILELFPREFEESELGMIPLGWEVKPISEVSSVAIGKTPPRKEPQWFTTNDNDIKWVSIRDMGNNGMYTIETKEYLTREAIEKFNVKVIPVNTVLLSFKLTLGRVSITTEDMTSNEAIAHFVLDDSSLLSTEYIYCYLKSFDYSILGSTSSIATAINSKIVKTIPTIVATETIIQMFNRTVAPMFKQILSLTKEIQALENTRDTLLPKLLSGELDVSNSKVDK